MTGTPGLLARPSECRSRKDDHSGDARRSETHGTAASASAIVRDEVLKPGTRGGSSHPIRQMDQISGVSLEARSIVMGQGR
jgi:hypothetical protein